MLAQYLYATTALSDSGSRGLSFALFANKPVGLANEAVPDAKRLTLGLGIGNALFVG